MANLKVVSSSKFEALKESLFASDAWSFSDIGYKKSEIQADRHFVKFTKFRLPWLKNLVKEAIWRKRSSVSYNTLLQYIKGTSSLDNFLYAEYGAGFKIEDLQRPCLEAYLAHNSNKSISTQRTYLSCNNELIECWKEWGMFPAGTKLIYRDDLKGTKPRHHPRNLSVHVQRQLDQISEEIPETIQRMIFVLREVGLRIGELISLKKQCLSQDRENGWYMTSFNFKFKKDHTIPVSSTVVEIIKLQLQETNRLEKETRMSNREQYLFVHYWGDELRTYTTRYFNQALKKLGKAIDLKDELGIPQKISSHQFRHTVGTNLINAGLSQIFVQKFLGHKSAEMTARYAEIHDSTLKDAITKIRGKLVDIKGNLYDAAQFLSDAQIIEDWDIPIEAKWLQRHLSAQSLPNGICALPVQQTCPHANACLTCPSFRTDITFISVHKEQLSRCRVIIQEGERRNMVRQVELNKRIASNIGTIISSLEVEPDANS